MKRPNPVLAIVRQRMAGAKTLSENVAVLFNRGSDLLEDAANEELKLILLNFMFLIFQEESTSQFFFVNDLKVVIDTIIRELNDQPAEEEIVPSFIYFFLGFLLFLTDFLLKSLFCPPVATGLLQGPVLYSSELRVPQIQVQEGRDLTDTRENLRR